METGYGARKAYIQLVFEFPTEEKYGLMAQIRRAAVSIPSNIAEGAARTGPNEFAHFLSIARGSLSELETQYLLAVELDMAPSSPAIQSSIERVSRLTSGLHKYYTAKKP